MARAGALKLVTTALEEPPGDPDITRKHVADLSPGQKRCRARGHHIWTKKQDRVYGTDANRPGTRVTRIQKCNDCKNQRERDFVVVSLGKNSRGLRKLDDKWHLTYVEVKVDGVMVPYLIPKGGQRITEELRELLMGEEFFADTTKGVIYVNDDGED
jgi:hypothetical protein